MITNGITANTYATAVLAEIQVQWVLGAEVGNGKFYFSYSTNYVGSIASLDYVTGVGSFTVTVFINGTPVTGLTNLAVSATRARALPLSLMAFPAGAQITGVITSAVGVPTDAVLNLNVVWN